jgi:hypothetical protein
MSEIAEYTIADKQYSQTYLTIEQTIQLSKQIKGIKFGDLSDILGILDQLVKTGKLKSLLEIVLDGPKPVDVNKIKPALLLKIIGDFFSFNEIFDLISTISDLMALVNDSGVLPDLTEKMKAITSQTGTS